MSELGYKNLIMTHTVPSQLCLRFCWSDVRTCVHVYDRHGKSSLLKRFLGSLPITTKSIEHF